MLEIGIQQNKSMYTLSVFLYVIRLLETKLNTECARCSQNEQITDKRMRTE